MDSNDLQLIDQNDFEQDKNEGKFSFLSPLYWISFFWQTIQRLTFLWVCSLAILWTSAFLYSMIYYLYIPMVSHTTLVHFQYDSTCDIQLKGACNNPYAEIQLSSLRSPMYFARGQLYKFRLDIVLPESEVNWNQGMFMVRLKLMDDQKKQIVNIAKPVILKYKSPLLRIIYTVSYWPLLVIGLMTEAQSASIMLIEDFSEGSYPSVGPLTEAIIEIEARQIQIEPPSKLVIHAHLQGLRYYMFNWPLTSALFGTFTIASFLSVLTLLSVYQVNSRKQQNQVNENDIYFTGELNGFENDDNENVENSRIEQDEDFDQNMLPDSSSNQIESLEFENDD